MGVNLAFLAAKNYDFEIYFVFGGIKYGRRITRGESAVGKIPPPLGRERRVGLR